MFNARILIKDFVCMWKIHDMEFQEYLGYNILYIYIIFNDSRRYGVLEHLMGYCDTTASWRWCTTSTI